MVPQSVDGITVSEECRHRRKNWIGVQLRNGRRQQIPDGNRAVLVAGQQIATSATQQSHTAHRQHITASVPSTTER